MASQNEKEEELFEDHSKEGTRKLTFNELQSQKARRKDEQWTRHLKKLQQQKKFSTNVAETFYQSSGHIDLLEEQIQELTHRLKKIEMQKKEKEKERYRKALKREHGEMRYCDVETDIAVLKDSDYENTNSEDEEIFALKTRLKEITIEKKTKEKERLKIIIEKEQQQLRLTEETDLTIAEDHRPVLNSDNSFSDEEETSVLKIRLKEIKREKRRKEIDRLRKKIEKEQEELHLKYSESDMTNVEDHRSVLDIDDSDADEDETTVLKKRLEEIKREKRRKENDRLRKEIAKENEELRLKYSKSETEKVDVEWYQLNSNIRNSDSEEDETLQLKKKLKQIILERKEKEQLQKMIENEQAQLRMQDTRAEKVDVVCKQPNSKSQDYIPDEDETHEQQKKLDQSFLKKKQGEKEQLQKNIEKEPAQMHTHDTESGSTTSTFFKDENKKILSWIGNKTEEENLKDGPRKMSGVHNEEVLHEHDINVFIDKIGLNRFYPGKLELSDIMKIEGFQEEGNLTNLSFVLARNLIMINFNSRDKMIQDYLRKLQNKSPDKSMQMPSCLDEMLGDDVIDDENESVSPLDLLLAVFKSSNPILQQIMTTKLFVCQLAVPLIFPAVQNYSSEVNIWPLRSISIESRTENGITQNNAVKCPCHIVSFVRIGRPSFSKSKLLNEILTDQYHNSFLNKDCPLGTVKRSISNGLVEASWYLPSSKSSSLKNVTVFLNLRGDSFSFVNQMHIMKKMSNVLVVILSIESLGHANVRRELAEMHQSGVGVLLAVDTKHHDKSIVREKIRSYLQMTKEFRSSNEICILSKDGQDRSVSEIKDEMRVFLRKLLDSKPVQPFINQVDTNGIKTDEERPFFRETKSRAESLIDLIPKQSSSTKEKLVPLQGKLWHSWSEKEKEAKKSSMNRSVEEFERIKKEMKKEREKQIKICESLGSFMDSFLASLRKFETSKENSILFISWLKLFLDERSREVIPQFLAKYQSDWRSLMSLRDKKDVSAEKKEALKRALTTSEINLAEASFGLEHLFREMGQIFEALSKSGTTRSDLIEMMKKLPEMAAQLVCFGQPFEIMDGDAANVPILWVKAVLDNLKKKLGDKRLLALSVLGIQSSGKSTLLNAMFGLQFAVSAGRCTRGVFMQIVPVEDSKLPFDFVLVIDTEGLRAPELAHQKYSHDNELATFVIGLGDITIVNIKGENTAEVKDVLQIAVHAFLRLMLANKGLNLKQKCVFVHQNVPALDANDKMMHGRQKFIEILDAMTKEAADQENIAEIQTFNQVIEFDSEKSVWYFSDLWRGDPPMAPVNPGYSENVSIVKDAILRKLTQGRDTYLTISNTIARISDLWEGILKDDFVFSFRNSLEFKAYNDIERQCHYLIWDLEKKVLEFVKSDAQTTLVNFNNEQELNLSIPKIMSKLNMLMVETVSSLLQKLDTFIEQNSLKDVMIQWKQNKTIRIKQKSEELFTKAKVDINNTKEEIRIRKLQSKEQTKHEMEINEKARELARKMKGKAPSEETMTEKFENMWSAWMRKFNAVESRHVIDIDDEIKNHTWETFRNLMSYIKGDWESSLFDYKKVSKLEGSISLMFISDTCIEVRKKYKLFNQKSSETCKDRALGIANIILGKIDTKLHAHSQEDTRFDISFVSDIFNIIGKSIEDFNKNKSKDYGFNLLPSFTSRLICHVARYASVFFKKLHEAYNNKHSPQAQMKAYKDTVWTMFKNIVGSKTEEVIAVGFFKEAIIKETKMYVTQLLHIDAQDKVLSVMANGKYGLIKEILQDDNVIENFQRLIGYIMDSSSFANTWISKLVDDTLFEREMSEDLTPYCQLAKKRVVRLFGHLKNAIRTATNKEEHNIDQWINIFILHINESKELPLSKEVFVHVKQRNIDSCSSFSQIILDEIDDMEDLVMQKFRSITSKAVKWSSCPVQSIMHKLWGCTATCMFCGEPCRNTDGNHVDDSHPHRCVQHRPKGVIGRKWEQTKKLTVDFCNHSVDSDTCYRFNEDEEWKPYRKYRDEFPNWDIAPSSDASIFWKWIFCKYRDEFTKWYKCAPPDIPNNWFDITKTEALNSLD